MSYHQENATYPTPPPNTRAGQPGTTAGISILEDRLNRAHELLERIEDTVRSIDARLYAPKPSAIQERQGGAMQGSVENSINALLNRLQEIDNNTRAILVG